MVFERIEMREKDCGDGQVWENPVRIEKHDHEYYCPKKEKISETFKELAIKSEGSKRFDPYLKEATIEDEKSIVPEYYDNKVIELKVKDEKSTSKTTARKPKKNDLKLH
jgi:hypothetical protein